MRRACAAFPGNQSADGLRPPRRTRLHIFGMPATGNRSCNSTGMKELSKTCTGALTADRIATASVDRTVRLWDAKDGSMLSVLTGHEDTIRAVEWSPRGDLIATASYDRTARIWDGVSGTEITVAGVHAHRTECLSWAPDGNRIAVGGQDRTVRIWRTSREIEKLAKLAQERVFRTLMSSERRNLMLPG